MAPEHWRAYHKSFTQSSPQSLLHRATITQSSWLVLVHDVIHASDYIRRSIGFRWPLERLSGYYRVTRMQRPGSHVSGQRRAAHLVNKCSPGIDEGSVAQPPAKVLRRTRLQPCGCMSVRRKTETQSETEREKEMKRERTSVCMCIHMYVSSHGCGRERAYPRPHQSD